jgi:hypothetical protein
MTGDQPSPDMQGLFAPFGDGGYKLGASVDTYAFFAQGRVTVATDELGLRCDVARRHAVKPGGVVDVLVMGDSQGFGNGVNFEDSIAGSFAELEAGQGLRVANTSVGGHSLGSQYEIARWLVETQHVKVSNFVLLLTPVMLHSGNEINRANVGADGRLYSGDAGFQATLNLWMKTNLVLYSRIRDAVRNYGIGAQPEARSAVFDYYQVGPQPDTARQELLAGIGQMKEFAAKHGANLYMVYVPLTVEADFAPVKQAAAKVGMDLDPDVSLALASTVANLLHVPLHSLKPVLQRLQAEGEQMNVKGDFHYSSILSRACGSDLAANLKLAGAEGRLPKLHEETKP